LFGGFVANLLGVQAEEVSSTDMREGFSDVIFERLAPRLRKAQYGVITLNYDMLLENVATYLQEQFNDDGRFTARFADPEKIDDPWDSESAPLAKLHGSVDRGNIVPPTWKKGVNDSIGAQWRCAYRMIEGANHIRFIGYSLAQADSYLKYLLKAGSVGNNHLKSIDVICKDRNGDVRKRFADFIRFPNAQFFDESTESYLSYFRVDGGGQRFSEEGKVCFNRLEQHHNEFVEESKRRIWLHELSA
jgi:hypothetical protein